MSDVECLARKAPDSFARGEGIDGDRSEFNTALAGEVRGSLVTGIADGKGRSLRSTPKPRKSQ